MADFGTWLNAKVNGRFVGADQFGNRYYEAKKATRTAQMGRKRRWVLYKGTNEASKIPPHWHAWIHHTVETAPLSNDVMRYDWQQEHVPNLSGTAYAYLPQKSTARGAAEKAEKGDYQAWTPQG